MTFEPLERSRNSPTSPRRGASYFNINLVGTPSAPTPALTSIAAGISYMQTSYTEFVTDSGVRDRLAQLFQKLASTSGAQVYHCSGGKDRTGWATTILLSILGVPQSVIVQDYLLTNVYSEASIRASYQQMVAAYGPSFADSYYPTFIADQRYIYAGLNQVVASYGIMANYINEGLGLSSIVQSQLCDRLLT